MEMVFHGVFYANGVGHAGGCCGCLNARLARTVHKLKLNVMLIMRFIMRC